MSLTRISVLMMVLLAACDDPAGDACEVPEQVRGCEGITPPGSLLDGYASGAVVAADAMVITFSDVRSEPLLCGGADLLECSCDAWHDTGRFTIGGVAPGMYGPDRAAGDSASGDCDAGGAEFDETIVQVEITAVTEGCVAGRIQLGDSPSGLPLDFGFLAPRCG